MKTFQHELAETLIKRHDNLSDLVVLFPSLRARTFFNHAMLFWNGAFYIDRHLFTNDSGVK